MEANRPPPPSAGTTWRARRNHQGSWRQSGSRGKSSPLPPLKPINLREHFEASEGRQPLQTRVGPHRGGGGFRSMRRSDPGPLPLFRGPYKLSDERIRRDLCRDRRCVAAIGQTARFNGRWPRSVKLAAHDWTTCPTGTWTKVMPAIWGVSGEPCQCLGCTEQLSTCCSPSRPWAGARDSAPEGGGHTSGAPRPGHGAQPGTARPARERGGRNRRFQRGPQECIIWHGQPADMQRRREHHHAPPRAAYAPPQAAFEP